MSKILCSTFHHLSTLGLLGTHLCAGRCLIMSEVIHSVFQFIIWASFFAQVAVSLQMRSSALSFTTWAPQCDAGGMGTILHQGIDGLVVEQLKGSATGKWKIHTRQASNAGGCPFGERVSHVIGEVNWHGNSMGIPLSID